MTQADLTDFLLARIAEREAVARAAGSGPWRWEHGFGAMCNDPECSFGQLMQVKEGDRLMLLMDVHGYDVHDPWDGAAHIALNDPAAVLARCAADRKIVERLSEPRYCDTWPTCSACGEREEDDRTVLQLMALPDAGHPDYQQEWAL